MEPTKPSLRALCITCPSVLLVIGIAVLAMSPRCPLPDSVTYNGQTYLRSEYPSDTGGLDLERLAYADRGAHIDSLKGPAVERETPHEDENRSVYDVFEFDRTNALLIGNAKHNHVYVMAEPLD